MAENLSLSERAEALERKMSDELDVLVSKSALFNMADGKLGASNTGSEVRNRSGKYFLMGDDPRLPKMPAKPTLLDFFKYRAKGINHMLQSATHALKAWASTTARSRTCGARSGVRRSIFEAGN